MQIQLKQIFGNWDDGYALHKHTLNSVYLGDDANGHPQFNTTRSEPGEALYKLKYRADWSQVAPIAAAIHANLLPRFPELGLIIPMPASNVRARQPVEEIANELSRLANIPVFANIIVKAPAPQGALQLKNLNTKAEKVAALEGRFTINPAITSEGRWNALLLDDLFDTGATMEAVCAALRAYPKIAGVFAAAVTWK
ncbi:MAG: amidophosphoribosyltransferase [Proteobacteria bacterium ST_bin14]|nr:MAG: amidophosphoribosyltransferase [Proteobacteria bacterium ST_bin14]